MIPDPAGSGPVPAVGDRRWAPGARSMHDRPWWTPIAPRSHAEGDLVEVDPRRLVDLRRRVLRDGRDDLPATYPFDGLPSTLHLGMVATDGSVVGGVSVRIDPLPGYATLHLGLMAVDGGRRGRGIGHALLGVVQGEARASGLAVWADARVSAIGFYEDLGFRPMGDVWTGPMQLPHRRILWRHR